MQCLTYMPVPLLTGQYTGVQALLTHLQDMVADTSAFAKQQRADADRSKRSYSQVTTAFRSFTKLPYTSGRMQGM